MPSCMMAASTPDVLLLAKYRKADLAKAIRSALMPDMVKFP